MTTVSDLELYRTLETEHESGRPVVLATVVSRSGSVPRDAGARMLIWANGDAKGSIGGGCVEADVRKAAREILLDTCRSRTLTVRLTEQAQGGTGDVCGGTMEIFLDYFKSEGNNG